jgi:hypothetical protein
MLFGFLVDSYTFAILCVLLELDLLEKKAKPPFCRPRAPEDAAAWPNASQVGKFRHEEP